MLTALDLGRAEHKSCEGYDIPIVRRKVVFGIWTVEEAERTQSIVNGCKDDGSCVVERVGAESNRIIVPSVAYNDNISIVSHDIGCIVECKVPDPIIKAPPWRKTTTGKICELEAQSTMVAGHVRVSLKQSSL